jgi:hypothetical protein
MTSLLRNKNTSTEVNLASHLFFLSGTFYFLVTVIYHYIHEREKNKAALRSISIGYLMDLYETPRPDTLIILYMEPFFLRSNSLPFSSAGVMMCSSMDERSWLVS